MWYDSNKAMPKLRDSSAETRGICKHASGTLGPAKQYGQLRAEQYLVPFNKADDVLVSLRRNVLQ